METEECDRVKCGLGGKRYGMIEILPRLVPLKSNESKETVTGIIAFQDALQKERGTSNKLQNHVK
jgi:hypothetical protein